MRAYHLLPADHALDDIRHRRLKIATFDELNDPFDLWAAAQSDRTLRRGLRDWKHAMTQRFGLLCFSRSWHSPVLWSHYADKHRGIAMGFDLNPTMAKEVSYVETRPQLGAIGEAAVDTLLYTKHAGWQYEEECRIFTRLEDRDQETGLFFADFGDDLALRVIIAGPLCTVPKAAIMEALQAGATTAQVKKARLAFKTFRVVTNREGFRAIRSG